GGEYHAIVFQDPDRPSARMNEWETDTLASLGTIEREDMTCGGRKVIAPTG
ncbi:hypothetical protein SERLA73DRAFT_144363, partial [Serpula lacrymans var. lacrymans S7.3]